MRQLLSASTIYEMHTKPFFFVLLYLSTAFVVAHAASHSCIPRIEYMTDESDSPLGSYERISPDGRYILRSFSGHRLGEVTIAEIVDTPTGKRIVHHATPLKDEAFPVQGNWRYLVNPNGDHYLLSDILEQGAKAKPKFRGGMTGFYAAAAELPSDKADEILIRSFSWPNRAGEGSKQGVGALSVRTISVNARTHRITSDTGTQFICAERRLQDGTQYGLPMISVDGTEFSAVPQSPRSGDQTLRVYAFGSDVNAPRCELKADLQFASGKATFGFPQSGGADLVFEYRSDVWWYLRTTGESFNLVDHERATRAGGFPGITRDGRVIVAMTWLDGKTVDDQSLCRATLPTIAAPNQCVTRKGYAIIDPYQSAAYQNYGTKKQSQAAMSCIKPSLK